ncbi:unnamed protein product, partial [Oppiella nova]
MKQVLMRLCAMLRLINRYLPFVSACKLCLNRQKKMQALKRWSLIWAGTKSIRQIQIIQCGKILIKIAVFTLYIAIMSNPKTRLLLLQHVIMFHPEKSHTA